MIISVHICTYSIALILSNFDFESTNGMVLYEECTV